jgi:hypothetical protein
MPTATQPTVKDEKITVSRFGESLESSPVNQWYETDKGERIRCDEEIIDKIWWVWIETQGVQREDDAQFTIFRFPSPTEVTLS